MPEETITTIAEVQAQTSGFDNIANSIRQGSGNIVQSIVNTIQGGLQSAFSGLGNVIGSAQGMFGQFGVSMGALPGLLAGATGGVVALGAALIAATASAASWDKQVKMLGLELGTTAEQSSTLLAMTERVGIGAQSTEMLFGRLSRSLQGVETAAESGGKGANAMVKELSAMGIATLDVHQKNLPFMQVLGNIADRFKNTSDAGERVTLAMRLFGRAGLEMLPFLSQGRDGMAALEQQVRKTGLVVGQDAVDAASRYGKALSELKQSFSGVGIAVGNALLPAMASVVTTVKDAITGIRDAFMSIGDLGKIIGSAFSDVHIDMSWFSSLWSALTGVLSSFGSSAWQAIVSGVRELAVTLRGVYEAGTLLFTELYNGSIEARDVLLSVKNQAMVPLSDAFSVMGGEIQKSINEGVSAFESLRATVISVANNILSGMKSVADQIIGFFRGVMSQLQPVFNLIGQLGGEVGKVAGNLATTGMNLGAGFSLASVGITDFTAAQRVANDVAKAGSIILGGAKDAASAFSYQLGGIGKDMGDAYNLGRVHAETLLKQRDATKDVTTATNSFAAAIPGVVEGIGNTGKAAKGAADQIQGLVEKFVTFTAFKDVGVEGLLPKLLGRKDNRIEDDVQEVARRVADVIANGVKSPHLESLKKSGFFPPEIFTKSIGDIQKFFAQWAVEYSKGFHPEALDKGMIEKRVEEEIVAEQKKAAYVKEIMADLARQGVATTTAQVKAAMSGVTGGAAGAAAGMGGVMQDMFTGFNPVGQINDLLQAGLIKYADVLKASGKALGGKIGDGILEGLGTQNYGQAIVDKITDQVLLKLSIRKQQTSTTGGQ